MALNIAVFFLVMSTVRALSGECSTPSTVNLRFSIGSRYNATGHNIITADVTTAGRNGSTLDVESSTASCGSSEASHVSAVAVRTPDRRSPVGYEVVPGLGVYKLHTNQVIWIDAKNVCESEGAHLMVANSKAEAGLVSKLCSKASCSSWLWAGFHDRFKKGHFITVTGQPLAETGFTVWESGQPGNDQCGCISTKGELCDVACSSTYPFICEFDS